MASASTQIDSLDVAVFAAIPSQTSEADRRSLLAVQRITRKTHPAFAYLEIGSHLGGSIQPYLLDSRCTKIYSLDPRPPQQRDDRARDYVARYDDNSSERMLAALAQLPGGDIRKIECLESDASDVDPALISIHPEVLFIDGEHTNKAALSDFRFCRRVASDSATIVFHDFPIIHRAVADVCHELRREGRKHLAFKLEDNVFAIFLDPEKVRRDQYLRRLHKTKWYRVPLFLVFTRFKRRLPISMLNALRSARDVLRKFAAKRN